MREHIDKFKTFILNEIKNPYSVKLVEPDENYFIQELNEQLGVDFLSHSNEMGIEDNKILGAISNVSFPSIGDDSFLAKIDTGADSSSIHCDYYYVKDDILYCKILSGKKILKFRNFSKKFIKSSNGEGSERYKVTLRVIIDGHEVVGKFSLNSRESMNYPILIGKNIIKKGFVVDVNKDFLEEN